MGGTVKKASQAHGEAQLPSLHACRSSISALLRRLGQSWPVSTTKKGGVSAPEEPGDVMLIFSYLRGESDKGRDRVCWGGSRISWLTPQMLQVGHSWIRWKPGESNATQVPTLGGQGPGS